jgi:hypothetical protein
MKDWLLRQKVAEHEAAHAVAAIKMGLTVAWVDINPGFEEGIDFAAAVKIPDETLDFERDVEGICVALAAPSFLVSHENVPELWRYAQLEADLAYELGGRNGIPADEIHDTTATLVADELAEILDLAARIEKEGRVVFETA